MQQIERADCIALQSTQRNARRSSPPHYSNKQSILEPSAMAKDKDHKDHKKPKEKEKKETKSKEPVSKPKEEEVFEELAKKKSHGGEQGKLQKEEIKAGVTDMVHKAGASSGPWHERPGGTRFITLAGENKGASMNIGARSKDKERHGHWRDGGDKEEGGKGMTPLINSNVQVINNSMLLKSSCSGGDPWVYLKLSAQAQSKSKDKQQQQRASDGGGVE